MDLGLKDKVVIVTGGAKGIGGGISEVFAEEGATVVIASRPSEAALNFAEELSKTTTVHFIAGDLTEKGACKQIIDETVEKFGRIDVLVNNAGVNDGVSITDSIEAFQDSLDKNLLQVVELVHYALPHLEATKGNIVNISSKVAETGQGHTTGYAASKGAMNALTREWALQFRNIGIRVNTVVPAECMTPMYQEYLERLENPEEMLKKITKNIPLENRMTTCEELASMTVFIASQKSSHTTGQILYVDGGYTHLDRGCTL